jgi:hypothetical protein
LVEEKRKGEGGRSNGKKRKERNTPHETLLYAIFP